jgi:hypothetical protein
MKRPLLVACAAALLAAPAALGDDTTPPPPQNAAQQCRAQRTTMGADAFAALYGTNGSKRNAFGKCAAKLAKAGEQGEESTTPASAPRRHGHSK